MEIGTCRCRTAPARVLRDEHEGKAFIRRELGSVFAEIDQGRGPEAFNIAAIRGQIEVGFQNSGFAVMTFEPESEPDLPEFILQAAGFETERKTGHLHGDGGAAHNSAAGEHSQAGPEKGQHVDAGMVPKIPVLVADDAGDGFRGDIFEPREAAVFVIRSEPHAQKTAIPVQDDVREGDVLHERRTRGKAEYAPEQDDGEEQNAASLCRHPHTFFHEKRLYGHKHKKLRRVSAQPAARKPTFQLRCTRRRMCHSARADTWLLPTGRG